MSIYEESLEYHSKGRKGKIEVVSSKPVATQKDLSLAYSPGVAEPCRQIAANKALVYEYTAKGNLVAVVTNGSAVLGLGGIGPEAAKPVMEGKGILFKKFADIDVFDIELKTRSPDDVIRACEMLEPTFGGINLEDIKAPECFYIEETLKKRLKIPVFHDDQHGTAVISGAAFLNALEVTKRKIEKTKVVFLGGGAASIACATLYLNLGVKKENVFMVDTKGIIHDDRTDAVNEYKARFSVNTERRTLSEALDGADALVACSVAGAVTADMIMKMAKNPIIFAMANPEPEIQPEEVLKVRPDAIMATGRSDFPNQVNNVLGFPFIFRGALDTHSTAINEEMKMAAVKALAELAKENVPENVSRAYGGESFVFGKQYLIPKPFDHRTLIWVSSAVAEAAMKSGVARKTIDLREYRENLERLLGSTYTIMRSIKNRVRAKNESPGGKPATIVFPEGSNYHILEAAREMREDKIAEPILIGDETKIKNRIEELGLTDILKDVRILNPTIAPEREEYSQRYYEKRCRKGATYTNSRTILKNHNYFAAMMVEVGHADALLSGVQQSYPESIKPALQAIGVQEGSKLAGIYMISTKKKLYWFADTTVNIDPTAEELAGIAIHTADFVKSFTGNEPKVAMLSFSNFGSNGHAFAEKVSSATQLVKEMRPDITIDGEMQVDTALDPNICNGDFPFNSIKGNADILIFPNLESGNIAYKLMKRIGNAEAIGPILVGMNRPVFVMERNSDASAIVNMAAITAMEVQERNRKKKEK